MDIVPSFWEWLDQKAREGIIFSSLMVCHELAEGDDDLADWVKERKDIGLFVDPDEDTQRVFGTIGDYVVAHYPAHNAEVFLSGADPWIIAHAYSASAVVVTHETLAGENASRVKIPNICRWHNVPWMNPYQMLRELEARF